MLQYWGNSYRFTNTNTNTLLLLHGDGSNGSTSIIDSSMYALPPSLTGSTQISTAQVKAGFGQSIWIPNNASQLSFLSLPLNFNFGTNNYTIEYFIYPTHGANAYTRYVTLNGGTYPNSDYREVTFRQNDFSKIELFYLTGNTLFLTNGALVSRNSWQHHAIVRNGTSLTAYVNGVAVVTLSVGSATFSFSSFYIAPSFESGNGYYDEVRVSNSAIYTSNFSGSVPTAPFAS